ncbi:protein Abitram-like [Physella acuta]|uniref:protein Abitram-like n=1 Tax=Physella acuta TaxID=109671 RepID=UPI0027DB9F57|nr:protein Abitram-like [Physella acuta]
MLKIIKLNMSSLENTPAESRAKQNEEMVENNRPPCVVDRYFKRRYKTDILNKAGEDQLVLTHSNRVCVICLAASHPLIRENKKITKVSFGEDKWNRLDNKFSGKSKRGAQWLDATAPLCEVTCEDGSCYLLTCCVKGQLIEVNENLLKNPQLLTQKPQGEGYLAVILPGLKGFEREMSQLKTEEDYKLTLANRVGNT